MTITLSPYQEQALQEAIRTGQVNSVEEFLDRAIASLGQNTKSAKAAPSVFEQGLGLFGNPSDAALLDEVVTLAYEERRHPDRPDLLL